MTAVLNWFPTRCKSCSKPATLGMSVSRWKLSWWAHCYLALLILERSYRLNRGSMLALETKVEQTHKIAKKVELQCNFINNQPENPHDRYLTKIRTGMMYRSSFHKTLVVSLSLCSTSAASANGIAGGCGASMAEPSQDIWMSYDPLYACYLFLCWPPRCMRGLDTRRQIYQ